MGPVRHQTYGLVIVVPQPQPNCTAWRQAHVRTTCPRLLPESKTARTRTQVQCHCTTRPHELAVTIIQRFSNWGPRTKGGPRRVPTGSARRFRKVVIVCTVFNNLRSICFQICTHKSVTQSQCIAWKCCRGLARQAFC